MTEEVRPTHLFAVRVWEQAIENDRMEWRGRVQYIPSGEVHFFREWPDLIVIMQQMLPDPNSDTADKDGQIGNEQ